MANADIEDTINQAYDIIDQMGEITQDTITNEDAADLCDAVVALVEVYEGVLDEMEITLDTTDAAGAAEDEMVLDETFAALQENYGILTQAYDAVAAAYNSDEIAANPEIEDVMNQAYELIDQMDEIKQDTITEEDAVALSELMVGIIDVLQAVVDEM